jgi:hypothetical protein
MKKSIISRSIQLPRVRKSRGSILGGLAAVALGLGLQFNATAQSDNFDSGTLSGAWTKYQFMPQSFTFPTVGSGKGLRIQAAPIPTAAPAAAAIAQATVYTDFYLAVDVVNWVVEDQAVVLLGHWTPGGAAGLAEGSGIILNYDAAQDGETAGDRKGGQLQINTASPGFATVTLAAADITFEPGRSYRLVFKCVGTLYTGQVYDLNDLATPLVNFTADDSTYPSGMCGFLSSSRNGTTGSTDVTIDNYYAAVSDPNTAIAPAIHHPLFTLDGSGVPQVTTRTPAKRFTNFHPPASGISFTANTFTAGQINASATKLYLNEADVSASLAPLPANGSTVSFSTAAGTLVANKTYAARIELQDTTGTLKFTNTFWFDTFSDAYLKSAGVKTIEAEDYNYNNGQFQTDPIPVSGKDPNDLTVNGSGVGYFDLPGTAEVDYSKPAGNYHIDYAEYRTADRVQITQGSYTTLSRDEAGDILDYLNYLPPLRINDTQRSQYVATNVLEYQVRLTSPGDWMNYTRVFTPSNYYVYLRCASFGSTTVYLDEVTSDRTVTGQSTVRIGQFNVGNHVQRLNYTYEQLMAGSSPAVVSLGGTTTLRLTMGGTPTKDERVIVMDYLLLVPTSDNPSVAWDNFNDGNDTDNPVWTHYNPIGVGSFSFPNGNTYRIQAAASPDPGGIGQARAGSYLPGSYTDFCVMADIVNWDDTRHQIMGVMARIADPGPGTTTGYLFTHDRGDPANAGGDMDIVRLDGEAPDSLPTLPSGGDSLHMIPGLSYRLVFTGSGDQFRGRVYELPNVTTPVVDITASDATYASGMSGLLVADNTSPTFDQPADATFDNFLTATAAPELTITLSGTTKTLSWPLIPFNLQVTSSLSSPSWSTISTGITQVGDHYEYVVPTGSSVGFYRLSYP